MKILLVDVDSKIPNLALMKLSTYHKNKGDKVELMKLNYDYYPKKEKKIEIDASNYSKVFVSIIFCLNKSVVKINNCEEVSFGGTGYSLEIKLSNEIDDCEEDYSIYPENDISYGFITRGCIRNCYFCFVPKKEGYLHKYREIEDIVKHKKVKFMDNNILAYEKCNEELKKIINMKLKCEFNQALDIRLIDDEKARLISQINYIGEYTFSFDNIKDKILIESKLKILKKYISKDWRIKMFLYVNPNMKIKETIDRIEWCRENKILPYVMRDISCWESEYKEFYIDISAYCNQPNIFKKMSFKEFILRRTNNVERQNKGISLWCVNEVNEAP